MSLSIPNSHPGDARLFIAERDCVLVAQFNPASAARMAATNAPDSADVEPIGAMEEAVSVTQPLAPPDMAQLRACLSAQGLEACHIDEAAAAEFIRACADAQGFIEARIGERRHGEFALSLSDDLLAAYLTLLPPQGGQAVGVAAILDALMEQRISHGLKQEVLDAAMQAGQCEQLLIAEGTAPSEGQPARFEVLYPQTASEMLAQTLDADTATIKLTDICRLILVRDQEPLMRRHPAIPGQNGVNVRGEVVLAKPVNDEGFAAGLQGVALDPEDANLLRAAQSGQPMLLGNGVSVNPVLYVAAVDLETGSIEFDGTLKVAGDIHNGLHVRVSGDVLVDGTVEAAEIHAGGNVEIKGGIIGRSEGHLAGSFTLPPNTARIRCQGSLTALFAESADIEAGDNIYVEREANHCRLTAGKQIQLGEQGKRGGHLVGGLAQASLSVSCMVLGNVNGTSTLVQVGLDPYLDAAITELRRQQQQKALELERVLQLQRHLQQNPQKATPEMLAKLENTRVQILADNEALNQQLAEKLALQQITDQAHITVHKTLHFGCVLKIGQQTMAVNDDFGAASARLVEGELMLER